MCGDKSKIACPSKVVFFCERELNGVDQKDSIRKLMFVTRARRAFSVSKHMELDSQGNMGALYVLCGDSYSSLIPIVTWLTRAAASLDLGCSIPFPRSLARPPSVRSSAAFLLTFPTFGVRRRAAAGRGLLESPELGSVVADTLTAPPRHSSPLGKIAKIAGKIGNLRV